MAKLADLQRRMKALEKRGQDTRVCNPYDLTDAQLARIAGFDYDPTDEELQRVVELATHGHR